MALRYVVTGCAASGTRWAARLMTMLGSTCGHQRVHRVLGTYRQQARRVEGDSSFFAVGQLPEGLPVLLLVRDPLAVLRSLDRMTGFLDDNGTDDDRLTTRYITRHLPTVGEAEDRLGRLIRYVAGWDTHLSRTVALRVEDAGRDPAAVASAYQFLTGRTVTARQCRDVLDRLGTRTNSHGGHTSELTWHEVLAHPDGQLLVDKAKHWGYL